jgi:2'-5' RNA ligase
MRLFVALELSTEAHQAASGIQRALRQTEAAQAIDAGWSRPEGLHLTLYFLGSVAPDRLPAIEASLASIAAAQKPFRLGLTGAGSFSKRGSPQILWLGIGGSPAELAALRGAVFDALAALGFKPSPEEFTPHVTLLRLKRPRGGRALLAALSRIPLPSVPNWQVGELVLFESRSSPSGSTYHPVARFALSAMTRR